MKKAAILPAQGIGDALLMLIASYHLHEAGYIVTTYHPALAELSSWLKNKIFLPFPNTYELEKELQSMDIIILQNDNSLRSKQLIELRSQGKLQQLSIFYPTYQSHKHSTLKPQDHVFKEDLCMAENIAAAIAKILHLAGVSRNNGICPPPHLTHRKHKKRVLIHPSSSAQEKNWDEKKFFLLAKKLRKMNFFPVFAVSSKEHKLWIKKKGNIYETPEIHSLAELAEMVYESGYVIGNDSLLGHLASNLHIPSLIIANDKKRMRLWRPGWLKGEVITPSNSLFSYLLLKLDRTNWKRTISVKEALDKFKKLSLNI
jgi:hypothetical protein